MKNIATSPMAPTKLERLDFGGGDSGSNQVCDKASLKYESMVGDACASFWV